jgi:hypothetical protein
MQCLQQREKETAKDYKLHKKHNIQAAQQEHKMENLPRLLKKVTGQKTVLGKCLLWLAEHKVP